MVNDYTAKLLELAAMMMSGDTVSMEDIEDVATRLEVWKPDGGFGLPLCIVTALHQEASRIEAARKGKGMEP